VVARRRIIDEVRRYWGRTGDGRPSEQAPSRRPLHLFHTLPGDGKESLADVIPAEDEISRVIEKIDASREADQLLRAIDRRRRRMLVLHVTEHRTTEEIARRYGVTRARVSQLMAEACERARRVSAARGATAPPIARRSRARAAGPARLTATSAEKRAFAEFRQLQRAGLRRQEALAALNERQRALVEEYQRKSQRRVRARAQERQGCAVVDPLPQGDGGSVDRQLPLRRRIA
jgi:RNA polymerase sigma factor (sigma-70 family)